jgi:hypothetical protein
MMVEWRRPSDAVLAKSPIIQAKWCFTLSPEEAPKSHKSVFCILLIYCSSPNSLPKISHKRGSAHQYPPYHRILSLQCIPDEAFPSNACPPPSARSLHGVALSVLTRLLCGLRCSLTRHPPPWRSPSRFKVEDGIHDGMAEACEKFFVSGRLVAGEEGATSLLCLSCHFSITTKYVNYERHKLN